MKIASSYKLEWGSMWLVIHLNANCEVFAVEDHDHHAGGHVTPYNNETYEQLFVRCALSRGFAASEIDAFLESSKTKARQL